MLLAERYEKPTVGILAPPLFTVQPRIPSYKRYSNDEDSLPTTRSQNPQHPLLGMGDIFGSGAMTITGLWLLYFYIEVAGLSPAAAASIFAIAKIWDGITDPVMGYITDNIRTRWGGDGSSLFSARRYRSVSL